MAAQSNPQIERIREIGRGGFGVVYLGKYDGRQVAIKVIESKLSKTALAETQLLKAIHHPNIVHYIDTVSTNNDISLVMEYVEEGSLKDYIIQRGKSKNYWTTTHAIMTNVAYGMSFLHEKNIVHADLKSLNILLRRDHSAAICDFGLSKTVSCSTIHTSSAVRGTVRWMAPELCFDRPEKSSFSSDVWAFGCVLLEITSKEWPWIREYAVDQILINALSQSKNENIFADICKSQKGPDKIRSLLCDCCAWSKNERPNFQIIIDKLRLISPDDLKRTRTDERQQKASSKKVDNLQISDEDRYYFQLWGYRDIDQDP